MYARLVHVLALGQQPHVGLEEFLVVQRRKLGLVKVRNGPPRHQDETEGEAGQLVIAREVHDDQRDQLKTPLYEIQRARVFDRPHPVADGEADDAGDDEVTEDVDVVFQEVLFHVEPQRREEVERQRVARHDPGEPAGPEALLQEVGGHEQREGDPGRHPRRVVEEDVAAELRGEDEGGDPEGGHEHEPVVDAVHEEGGGVLLLGEDARATSLEGVQLDVLGLPWQTGRQPCRLVVLVHSMHGGDVLANKYLEVVRVDLQPQC